MSKKSEELLNSVDESRRGLLRKVLIGGAAVYVAPMIASFSLTGDTSGGATVYASNMATACHPTGGGFGVSVPEAPGHFAHGDASSGLPPGTPCDRPGN